ncbi:uncharacterized protein VP01_1549g5 [Puccinia sorghi]|uniref:Uncharacterized protein n=1 Tax=Puccinia sorghi TaxID=27349 RepID=A0A0L6VID3_9BASI|nr:uncharacterized protein VP01_1549g5 [Puccinia sorghi]
MTSDERRAWRRRKIDVLNKIIDRGGHVLLHDEVGENGKFRLTAVVSKQLRDSVDAEPSTINIVVTRPTILELFNWIMNTFSALNCADTKLRRLVEIQGDDCANFEYGSFLKRDSTYPGHDLIIFEMRVYSILDAASAAARVG